MGRSIVFVIADVGTWAASLVRWSAIRRYAKSDMYRTLALATRWNFPIMEIIESMLEQHRNSLGPMRRILRMIQKGLLRGEKLSDILARRPGSFFPDEVEMIRAGERADCLPAMLQSLAHFYESQRRYDSLRMVLLYPFFLFAVLSSVFLGILIFIMPKFVDIFLQLGATLPWLTESLMDWSDVIIHKAHFEMLLLIAGIFAWVKRGRVGYSLGRLVPLACFRLMPMARFFNTLGTLLQAGIPVTDALETAGRAAHQYHITRAATRIRECVTQGLSLSAAMQKERVIPRRACMMIELAESTGNVPMACEEISQDALDVWEKWSERFARWTEPACVLVMGVGMACVIIALYLPLFDLPRHVQ